MNFRTLNGNDLASFAANVNTLLAGAELSSIDTNVRNSLAAAIGAKPDTLSAQAAAATVAEGERKAAVSAKKTTRSELIGLMSQVRDALKAGLAAKEEYDLCGFDYPSDRVSVYEAQSPTELSAFGYSNGVIRIRFSGNNKRGRVVYEIWRRHDAAAQWALYATTKKQSFTDTPVTPGQYFEYKVRAVASKSISSFSNSAIVYGVV